MMFITFLKYKAHKNQQIRLKDVFFEPLAFGTVLFFKCYLSDTLLETNSNGFLGNETLNTNRSDLEIENVNHFLRK